MKTFIRQRLREEISASDAYTTEGSIQTLINGERNVGFISLVNQQIINYILQNNINLLKVPSNEYNSYIIYVDGSENQANELLNIAEKYGGFLSFDATKEDSRRIGQLLNYKSSDIEDYINKNEIIKQNNKNT